MRDGSAAATAGEATDRLAEAVKTGETTVGSVKPEQVKDAETLDVLSKLLKQAKAVRIPAADANQWLLWELRRGRTALGDAAGKADGLAKRVAAAVKAVQASKAAKELADAKAALKSKVEAAKKILADSNGRVQDENTRS